MNKKIIIYQTFPRIATNRTQQLTYNGTRAQNGCGKMNQYTSEALEAVCRLGCNYIWYTGLIQHATCSNYSDKGIPVGNRYVIKGNAGSPYAITDYYSVDPDLAENVDRRMEEFAALVERTHIHQLKMIIDFVPNHVARQYHSVLKPKGASDFGEHDQKQRAFDPQNNFYYIPEQEFAPHIDLGSGAEQYHEYPAKATGNDCFHAFPGKDDWYETVKLNYGVDYATGKKYFSPIPDTWEKMLHILLYWAEKGIDGFRCDMAHMVPIEFWNWVIPRVKARFPDIIFIAEIYTPSLYRCFLQEGHFDYLYDKVGLYDTLRAVVEGKESAAGITAQWQALEGIQKRMVNFLENHDEQRLASDFFAGSAKKGIPALMVSAWMNTNPFMLYFGQELGERGMGNEGFSGCDGRTSIFDYTSLDSYRRYNNNGQWNTNLLTERERDLLHLYQQVLSLCNKEKALCEGCFYDLMYVNYQNSHFDPTRQYAFLRHYQNELLLICVNFSDQVKPTAINIPEHAFRFLGIEEGDYQMKELLTQQGTTRQHLSYQKPFKAVIAPYSGVIYKFVITVHQDE